ncbi:MAG TPA: ABC transporter substrate-binding protein [candidate division Zixibacteria bacterium]|nr:ABC transporter substrate-binding protein [candidate division Zixibacteria bacterium]
MMFTETRLSGGLKVILLAAALGAVLSLHAFSASAAEKADKPIKIQMDFIIGGKHAIWYVALDKGFYLKRGLSVTIQPGAGSADTVRAIGAGLADVGFADFSTAIVAKSRGTPVQAVAQLGYMPATILWREDTPIKTLKDLEGKSWAVSPGQAHRYLMPAFAKINHIDFTTIKIQDFAPALLPSALIARKADFVGMFRASNDEVTEMAATKQGIKLKRVFLKDNGLNIYGGGLIVREENIKRGPDVIRAYVEGTMEGLRYSREHPDEALQILMKHKPELNRELTRIQLKSALEEIFIPPESLQLGFGYIKPDVMEKTVAITNEYFDTGRKVSVGEVYTNQFIRK